MDMRDRTKDESFQSIITMADIKFSISTLRLKTTNHSSKTFLQTRIDQIQNFRKSLEEQEYKTLKCYYHEEEGYMLCDIDDTSCNHGDDIWLSCDNESSKCNESRFRIVTMAYW